MCKDYCVIFNTWEGEYYGFIMNILCHYSPLAAKLNKPFYCECIIKCRNTIYHAVKMWEANKNPYYSTVKLRGRALIIQHSKMSWFETIKTSSVRMFLSEDRGHPVVEVLPGGDGRVAGVRPQAGQGLAHHLPVDICIAESTSHLINLCLLYIWSDDQPKLRGSGLVVTLVCEY